MSGEPIFHDLLVEWLNPDCGYFFRQTRKLEEFDSAYQHVEVFDTPQYGRLFRLDGCFMTSEGEEWVYHENLVHPAAISHPGPQQALVIGGGDGGSSEELLKHPSLERLVLCELDPAVVDVARRHFEAIHHNVFDDARLQLRIGDGLAYIRETPERFDLIVLDLPDPGGPACPLYTEAFYSACRERLSPGGALSLHVGSPVTRPERFRETVAKLKSVFSLVRPYLVHIPLYGTLWGMACASDTLDPLGLSAEEVERRIGRRGIRELNWYNGDMHRAVFALPTFVRRLVSG